MKHPIVIFSEKELVSAFRARDRKYLEFPKRMTFPLEFENYLTWSEPTGNYQFLIFPKPVSRELVGMVFNRSDAGLLATKNQMCNWCRAFGPSDQIDMLTIEINSKVLVGIVLCIDLSCIEKIETTGKSTKKTFDQLALDLIARMNRFYERKIEKSS